MAKKKKRLRTDRLILVIIGLVVVIGLVIGGIFLLKDHKKRNTDTALDASNNQETETKTGIEALYYYEPENQARYEAYQALHPELAEEDVVWMVNVHLDEEPYTNLQVIPESEENNEILLVNKHYCYRDEFEPAELVETQNGKLVTPNTKTAYEKMVADAKAEGITGISAASTYRSIDYQVGLYNRYVERDGVEAADAYSSRPASSEHHTGRTIDLMGPDGTLESFESTKACTWVHANAYKYGFIIRYEQGYEDITGYQYEPWHITYVGVEASTTMHDEGIHTLEEYYAKYVQHQPTQS